MVSYLLGFAVIGIGMILAGFNQAVTIINYRAPGMTWSRVPIFVWSILATAALLTLATPVLFAGGLFGLLDKTVQTAFYVTEHGGSSYLWQNLSGSSVTRGLHHGATGLRYRWRDIACLHPTTALRLQGGGRWHDRRGVAVLLRVAASPLSERHQPRHATAVHVDHRTYFDPDGFHLPGGHGNVVSSKDQTRDTDALRASAILQLPHRWCDGVFLSDVPVNVTVHGGFFVLSHFHYTIMGGLLFAFMAGLYSGCPR